MARVDTAVSQAKEGNVRLRLRAALTTLAAGLLMAASVGTANAATITETSQSDRAGVRPLEDDTFLLYAYDTLVNEYTPGGPAHCVQNVAIQSWVTGKFVSTELGSNFNSSERGALVARADNVDAWERYTICIDSDSNPYNPSPYWTIRSQANGLLVSAEYGYSGTEWAMLRARSTSVGAWEKFDLNCQTFLRGCTFQSLTGHYNWVSAHGPVVLDLCLVLR
jgi:hypothetical protein